MSNSWLTYPSHGKSAVRKLAINIPSSVNTDNVRVDKRGDAYADRIYKKGGAYSKLAKAFQDIADDCEKALNASNFKSNKLRKELRQAKKTTNSQAGRCRRRQDEIKTKYYTSKDVYNSIEK